MSEILLKYWPIIVGVGAFLIGIGKLAWEFIKLRFKMELKVEHLETRNAENEKKIMTLFQLHNDKK